MFSYIIFIFILFISIYAKNRGISRSTLKRRAVADFFIYVLVINLLRFSHILKFHCILCFWFPSLSTARSRHLPSHSSSAVRLLFFCPLGSLSQSIYTLQYVLLTYWVQSIFGLSPYFLPSSTSYILIPLKALIYSFILLSFTVSFSKLVSVALCVIHSF